MRATGLVVGVGDRVSARGCYVAREDGGWLDLARFHDLMFHPIGWVSDRAMRLTGPDAYAIAPTSRWTAVTVTGIWRGDVIEVNTCTADEPRDRPDAEWTNAPCPPPPRGWGKLPNGEQNLRFDLGDLQSSGAAVSVITFRPEPGRAVLVVAATDVAAVQAALGPQLPDQLCVVSSRFTRRQLNYARDHARERWHDWSVEIVAERCDEAAQASVEVGLLRVTPDIADWADALPEGLVNFDPMLTPASAE